MAKTIGMARLATRQRSFWRWYWYDCGEMSKALTAYYSARRFLVKHGQKVSK